MIKNYLITALRNLRRNKIYTFVSTFGLALGISCTLLIALYIQDEMSYENFQENKSRIYRLSLDMEMGNEFSSAVTNMAGGPMLVEEYPEIEKAVRMLGMGQATTVSVGDKTFRETGFAITDSTFFEVFTFPLIQGSAEQVLRKPNSIVLTKSLAEKYFGKTDVLGEQLKVNNSVLTVDGVVNDPPANTQFQFNALRPFTALPPPTRNAFMSDWYMLVGYTYLLTAPDFDPVAMETKLGGFYEKYIIPFQEANNVPGKYEYHFDPLEGLHFNNLREYDLPRGNIKYIYIFSAIAVFILLIACINFINLSLAQSSRRGKEVGIRKTLGAHSSSIRKQFLGESFLIVFISLIGGLVIVELMLSVFNDLTEKSLNMLSMFSVDNLFVILGIFIAVGLLSGFYPALVLSRLYPIRVLKGKSTKMGQHGLLRRTLVVVQFIFSIAMIIGTLVVFEQFSFMKEKDMGFNKDQVALIQLPADTSVVNHSQVFKQQLAQISGVSKISSSGDFPGSTVGEILFRIESNGQLTERGIKFMSVDEHFLDLYDIELQHGRNFQRERSTDNTTAFIINETAARQFGWTEDPLGKRMQWGLEANNQATNDGEVVGVVGDFNFQSLHNPIEPFVFIFNPNPTALISFRIAAGQIEPILSQVRQTWSDFAGKYDLDLKFVDEQFDLLYANEEKMLTIFSYFAALSIFIACLGLFALASFTVAKRTKEIGIRKVLGASEPNIVIMINKDFLKLILISLLFAFPIAFYAMNTWLQDFAYRISIGWMPFFIAGTAALLIAVVTVSYHAIRASISNPVKSLRYE